MLFSSINRFSSRQFRSSSSIASALLLMDLGGDRLKMARKNCDRKNGKRLLFFKRWYAVGQRVFSTVRKLYIDAYCMCVYYSTYAFWPLVRAS